MIQSPQITNAMAANDTIRAVELGKALRDDRGEVIEHFGYVDVLGRPLYLKSDFAFDENGDKCPQGERHMIIPSTRVDATYAGIKG